MEMSKDQVGEWSSWLSERPPHVRAVAESVPPFHLYRLVETGQNVRIRSYDESDDGSVTLTVMILPEDNPGRFMLMGRGVFGIDPSALELSPDQPSEVS